MKISITTALSIAGVLAAGVAAYAVNVSVLDAPSPLNASSVSTAALASGMQASATPASETGSVTAQAVRINDTTSSYQVGKAGSVVVSTASGAVVVTSVVPNTGYTAEPARTEGSGLVKVHFNSSTSRIEFTAQLVNGAVVVKVVNESMPAPGAGPGGAPSKPVFPGAGDDDDEHEGRHHDDDDDDDEDHDDDHEYEGDDD
ncbi:MAG: hypothetical protein RLZ18_1249 [Actinomycetota bacterium]